MTKPENPGQGNGNNGNDPNAVVIVRLPDETIVRFDGVKKYRVDGGCLIVGTDAFAPAHWKHVWVETLPMPPEGEP